MDKVLFLKNSALNNFKFSCRMFWKFSCKIVAKSQNHRIIGGSNPSASFQVQERGCHHNPRCHIVHFLCSSSISSSLLVRDTTFIECCGSHKSGRDFLFSMTRKTDMASMRWLLPGQRTASLRWTPGTRGCRNLMCYFITKHDGQILGE